MSTLQRVYQIIAAHLYRAESRSGVAEEAWAIVTAGDLDQTELPEQTVVATVRAARARAIASIVDGNHPPSITESAVDTLDHALYAAMVESGLESATASQSASDDQPPRGPRL